MHRTILIPLDGSKFAENALLAAAEIAKLESARLHLVRAHEPPLTPVSPDVMVPYDAEWDAALRQEEREYLASVANRIQERWGLPVRTEIIDGAPAVAIATYAREMDIDLIVMTTHGRSGLSRMWLGSVADGVIRRSGVPVLLLRAREGEEVDAPILPHHILIPLDGSELSAGVVEPAAWLGSLAKARFTLLNVVLPAPLLRPPLAMIRNGLVEELNTEQTSRAKERLEEVAGSLRARGFEVDTAVVMDAVPAQAILDYANSRDIDLIALATHGRGGWSRLALGSVADKVLRGADVPVLVFRPTAHLEEGTGKQGADIAAHV